MRVKPARATLARVMDGVLVSGEPGFYFRTSEGSPCLEYTRALDCV